MRRASSRTRAFTRIELLAVVACLTVLVLIQLPSLGKSREGGHEAVCMNNLRQLSRALMMYSEASRDIVPGEGNINSTIVNTVNADAWYNLAVQGYFPSMTSLYVSNNIPLPGNGSIYSCPDAAPPSPPPSISAAFFMYGINNRMCVNASSVAAGAQQTRLSWIIKPSDTIFFGEVDDHTLTSPSLSGITANFTPARHLGMGIFAMSDGHVRTIRTNDFKHTDTSAAAEWAAPQKVYWFPTPTTPN